MAGSNALVLLLCLCVGGSLAEARTKCNSQMPGDFRYEGCGGFCKPEKAQNHCKFCKCRACNFCASVKAGLASAAPETPAAAASPAPKKKKKAAEGGAGAAGVAEAAPAAAGAAALPAAGAVVKVSCKSGLKGDFNYQTCGAFCKTAKAANHCKFCKCKACNFCGGASTPSRPTPASTAAAPLPAGPAEAEPAGSPISATAGAKATHAATPPVPARAGLVGSVGGMVLLLIVVCGVVRRVVWRESEGGELMAPAP